MEPVKLDYDPGLTRACTWRMHPAKDGTIEAHVRMGEAAIVHLEVELRFRRESAEAPQALKCRPTDGCCEVWILEGARLHTDLPRIQLELAGTPAHVAEALLLL